MELIENMQLLPFHSQLVLTGSMCVGVWVWVCVGVCGQRENGTLKQMIPRSTTRSDMK